MTSLESFYQQVPQAAEDANITDLAALFEANPDGTFVDWLYQLTVDLGAMAEDEHK